MHAPQPPREKRGPGVDEVSVVGEMSDMASDTTKLRMRVRWGISLFAGLAVSAAVAMLLGSATFFPGGSLAATPAALLAGWSTLALVNVGWGLASFWPMSCEATRDHATAEDPGHRVARLIAICGSLVSLAAVVVVIVQSRASHGAGVGLLAGLALVSVVASWLFIQMNYMLHYARVYYEPGPTGDALGGIDFNQVEPPSYSDFAYFSVGLGLTYQVSDNDVSRNQIRRIVVAQTLIAYLFGAGILAVAINLVVGVG